MTRLAGQSVRKEFLMQTKADVTGLTVEVPAIEESTLSRAALLAGIGLAVYADFKDASAATHTARCTYEPCLRYRDHYEGLLALYAQILSRDLPSINRGLTNLETK